MFEMQAFTFRGEASEAGMKGLMDAEEGRQVTVDELYQELLTKAINNVESQAQSEIVVALKV